MAAATTAAAGAAARRGAGFGGAAGDGGTKDGKLDGSFLTGALGAGDFLLSVDHYFLKLGFAVVADVFVDGHSRFLLLNRLIIAIFCEWRGAGG